jgi:hypothetical protein
MAALCEMRTVSLLIVNHQLWCSLSYFKSGAYFLDLRCLFFEPCSERFNFLLLVRGSRLEVLLLSRDDRFQLLYVAVFFKELV